MDLNLTGLKKPKISPKNLKRSKNILMSLGYHARAQLLLRYMGSGMVAQAYARCTSRLEHGSLSPPSGRTPTIRRTPQHSCRLRLPCPSPTCYGPGNVP